LCIRWNWKKKTKNSKWDRQFKHAHAKQFAGNLSCYADIPNKKEKAVLLPPAPLFNNAHL
jgi:hypothetical protein